MPIPQLRVALERAACEIRNRVELPPFLRELRERFAASREQVEIAGPLALTTSASKTSASRLRPMTLDRSRPWPSRHRTLQTAPPFRSIRSTLIAMLCFPRREALADPARCRLWASSSHPAAQPFQVLAFPPRSTSPTPLDGS